MQCIRDERRNGSHARNVHGGTHRVEMASTASALPVPLLTQKSGDVAPYMQPTQRIRYEFGRRGDDVRTGWPAGVGIEASPSVRSSSLHPSTLCG